MPKLSVLYDPQTGHWLRCCSPVEELEVFSLEEVLPSLMYLEERVEQDGLIAAGFVSYEAAPAFDDALQTADPGDFPLLRFGLFANADRIKLPPPGKHTGQLDWQASENAGGFSRKISAVRDAIARGETYQVNLTFPFTAAFTGDPWSYFLRLVHGQRACGAGFLQTDRWAICSVSPELFFARDGDRLRMRPMKGTAPRGRTLEEDHRLAEALQSSSKNRAENIMILDMVRNDLGRLAPPGEVHTAEICTLEKYPTVWQLTSTVNARSNASLAETFQALFPCASITGAPKARTMQIIRACETGPRQIYTGAFGWIAPGRKAHFNVAIRTVQIDRQSKAARYGVGAGITWGSDSAEEYRECLDKAAVLSCPAGGFSLIETMLWTPGKGYFVLEEHLARLRASAEYFGFDCSIELIRRHLQSLTENFPRVPQRVRLLLHEDGQLSETYADVEPPASSPLRLRLARHPVDSQDVLLFHKTTRRMIYENHRSEAEDADEVVLWNERGEVTECCSANLVVEKQGRLVTPPAASGLLPGTYRAFLLRKGVLSEQVLTPGDLYASPRLFLINALRKWRQASLL